MVEVLGGVPVSCFLSRTRSAASHHPPYLPPNGLLGLRLQAGTILTTGEVVRVGTLHPPHHHGNPSGPHPRPPLGLSLLKDGWLWVEQAF